MLTVSIDDFFYTVSTKILSLHSVIVSQLGKTYLLDLVKIYFYAYRFGQVTGNQQYKNVSKVIL